MFERIHFPSIASTQTEAKSHLEELMPGQWRVYTADEQSVGQGTHGRTWVSPRGNIYASYIFLLPEKAQKALPHISTIAAVSIVHVLRQQGVRASVKWVNDVLVDRKKIAGILSQAKTVTHAVGHLGVCIGIGINVNVENSALAHIKQPTTSMQIVAGRTFNLDALIDSLSTSLKESMDQLIARGYGSFRETVNSNLERFGSIPIIFDTEASVSRYHIGTVRGVDERGALQLETVAGKVETFINGRILRGREIEEALSDEVLSQLIHRHAYESIASTQLYARENLRLVQDTCWHLITAVEQTGGMGQSSRKWHSPAGNLYATFMLPKGSDLTTTRIQVSEVVALTVAEVLRAHRIDAGVKWRNDVKVGEKKISGVLVEINDTSILIGVGININVNPSATATLDQETTSLKEELLAEEDLAVEGILSELQHRLFLNLEVLVSYGFSDFLQRLNELLLYKGEVVSITPNEGERVQGVQGSSTPCGGVLLDLLGNEKEILEGELRPVLVLHLAEVE